MNMTLIEALAELDFRPGQTNRRVVLQVVPETPSCDAENPMDE